jgi:hypothetical protein
MLVVTNQHTVLQPASGNTPVSIPLNKVLSYTCYNNGIEVHKKRVRRSLHFLKR